jgi:hypothetical protein
MRFGRNEKLMPLIKVFGLYLWVFCRQNAALGCILSVSIKCVGTLIEVHRAAGARFPASLEAFLCHGLPESFLADTEICDFG